MATLREYARAMIARDPHAVGRVEAVASLATTTVTVSALAFGGWSPQAFVDHWLVRRDGATADRIRRCTNFASSTGVLTHAGTNYSDTTATSEMVEIYPEHVEPRLVDNAINVTCQRLRREDQTELPTRQGERRYWIGDLDWIRSPGDITKVTYRPNPVYSRNRYFEKWNAINTSGVLLADWWTLAGASATAVRSTTQNRRGTYSVALTRAGTDLTYTQTVGLLESGVDGDSLRGKTVTVVGVGWASVADRLRFTVSDGVTSASTSYHTGGSSWEELSTTLTVSDTATTLTIRAEVNTGDTTAYVDECYLVETLTDSVRRDSYGDSEQEWGYEQGGSALALILPERGHGGQYVVHSLRGYPGFDATRLAAGTADGDTCDAPLVPVATGAIARLYESLADRRDENTLTYRAIAADWQRRFEALAMRHTGMEEPDKGGINLPRGFMMAPPARRF